jgi:hypothetical protein
VTVAFVGCRIELSLRERRVVPKMRAEDAAARNEIGAG